MPSTSTGIMTGGWTQRLSHSSAPLLQPNDYFFCFTQGRFVSKEAYEMSQRYVRFDINELARLAAEAVGSQSCVDISKHHDGMYNKVFFLTMENGTQAVAKVPNPNAGRPHFTTASEVATMDFVRNVLGTPVPKVYAWSSKAQENSVGAEYIIMEKLLGIPLDDVWPSMVIGDRFAVAKTIAGYQKDWMSVSFKQFGGLYYSQDLGQQTPCPLHLDQNGVQVTDSRFAIGPSTGREFFDDERATIAFDEGPWNTLEECQSAIGYREIACVKSLPQLPKSPITLCGPGTYQPTRERKLKALHSYLTIMKYVLPTDQSITTSCLWHDDLHVENIIVNPENPTEVLGIIDWQTTELAPLFQHARQPHFLDCNGPLVRGLKRPLLPENFTELDPAAQKETKTTFLNMSLSALYKFLTYKQNPRLYHAIEFRESPSFDFLWLARNLLIDGEATYLAQIVELEETWADLPGVRACGSVPFPFQFSSEEKAEIASDVSGMLRGMEAMDSIKTALGDLFPEKGIVQAEHYDETKDALQQMKEQVIEAFARNESERAAWREEWPFDD